MPKIKSLLNGNISNVRGDIAREMVKMGVAEIIGEDPDGFPRAGDAAIPPPEWSVCLLTGSGFQELVIKCVVGKATYYYSGLPKGLNDKEEWPGGFRYLNGFGREIPAHIVDEYTRAYAMNPAQRGAKVVEDASFRHGRSQANAFPSLEDVPIVRIP